MTSISNICHLLSRSIPGRNPRAVLRKARVLIYALRHPFAARIWFGTLTETGLLADIAVRNRRYLERPFRRSIQADMRACARAALLCGHFRVVREFLGDDLVRRLYLNSEEVRLALSGRHAIVIGEPIRCWREGLLTVAWRDVVAQADLAWATISFEWDAEAAKRRTLIGGLQGPAAMGKELVRDATRACHGLRPKAAVLEAVCALSRLAGVDELCGVTNKTHVSSATPIKLRADYDGYWQEVGGVEVNGRYRLPIHPYHRDVSDVPSHRRAEFRRRQTLIADLLEQIAGALKKDHIPDAMLPRPSHSMAGIHSVDLVVPVFDAHRIQPGRGAESREPTRSDRRGPHKVAA